MTLARCSTHACRWELRALILWCFGDLYYTHIASRSHLAIEEIGDTLRGLSFQTECEHDSRLIWRKVELIFFVQIRIAKKGEQSMEVMHLQPPCTLALPRECCTARLAILLHHQENQHTCIWG